MPRKPLDATNGSLECKLLSSEPCAIVTVGMRLFAPVTLSAKDDLV